LNQQYVVEGFTSGSVTCAGALALVLLSHGPQLSSLLSSFGIKVEPRSVFTLCAGLCAAVLLCYVTMISYLKQKLGGY
jgi:hypothetical protein